MNENSLICSSSKIWLNFFFFRSDRRIHVRENFYKSLKRQPSFSPLKNKNILIDFCVGPNMAPKISFLLMKTKKSAQYFLQINKKKDKLLSLKTVNLKVKHNKINTNRSLLTLIFIEDSIFQFWIDKKYHLNLNLHFYCTYASYENSTFLNLEKR